MIPQSKLYNKIGRKHQDLEVLEVADSKYLHM